MHHDLQARSGAGHFVEMVHKWTALAAVEEGVPAYVLTTALFGRSPRGEGGYADRWLSAMRSQSGGHAEGPPAPAPAATA